MASGCIYYKNRASLWHCAHVVICCKSWFGSLKTDFILEVASNFTATVQRILNCSAFSGDVYNWFIFVEEPFSPLLLYQHFIRITNKYMLWNPSWNNSVKAKDYTYSDLTTPPEVFCWVTKRASFVNFQGLLDFEINFEIMLIQYAYSQKLCLFIDRHCCINMAKACHMLSCLKLYFTFYLLGTIIILCQKTDCSVFLHLLKGCMFTESVYVLGFYDELFYHFLKRLGSCLLLKNEGENWKAGLWK